MPDDAYVQFLQSSMPRLGLRWQGFRKVRGQVIKRIKRRLHPNPRGRHKQPLPVPNVAMRMIGVANSAGIVARLLDLPFVRSAPKKSR